MEEKHGDYPEGKNSADGAGSAKTRLVELRLTSFGAAKPRQVRGKLPPILAEPMYEFRIDYDIDDNDGAYDKVMDMARRVCPDSVGYADSTGGPCWQAYIELKGEDKGEVERAARAICQYIRRFRGHVFYVWDDAGPDLQQGTELNGVTFVNG